MDKQSLKKKTKYRAFLQAFIVTLMLTAVCGCGKTDIQETAEKENIPPFTHFSDIPGLTEDEIKAVERLSEEGYYFVYGTIPSTETFVDQNGEIRGFTALFCEWLTELFGISFKPEIFEWGELLTKLETGEVDFTGELTATEDRRQTYYMTDTIAGRSVKYMRITGHPSLSAVVETRTPRCAFLRDTTTYNDVRVHLGDTVEYFMVDSYEEAYRMMRDDEADVFFDESTAEAVFDAYGDVTADDFLPLIYGPVSLTTGKRENKPVIDIVQKALRNDGLSYLTQLYLRGEKEYKRQKLTSLLTPEEREYIKNNPSVKFAAEYDNYPASIYNFREAEWQGVCFDVIAEVEELTGLTFKLVSDEYTQWPEILNMLENGEVSVISELIRTPDREGRFLWPETPLFSDLYALVSKSEQHKVNFNEVWISKVGVVTNSAQNEMFERWFPNHLYKKEYPGYEHAFFALQNDEVDLLMASRNQLMALTHYQEQAGYKTNIIFNYTLVSTFGFNINEVVLCSVVDKALRMTDTKGIADEWTGRTYDYRRQMADSRRPWVIGAVSSLGCLVVVLCFLIILMLRGRTTERLAIEANIREQSLISDNEALDRLNRMKNEFFENMSHDFKTPLNVISTSVFNVIDMCDFELDKTTVKEVLGNANHEIMLMARMVDSAMKYSDLQDDRKEMEPLDIAPLLREGAETYRALLERNGNKLSIDIPPALPLVLGNGDMLLHVLSNILSNSNRHTRDGEISVRAFEENGMITVTVRDNGAGIKPDILQRIFDRGVSDGGTGLGLSICKSAIEAHGGTISAESENLQGAVLTFTLPLYTGPNDKEHENG